jgi:hypothetical protein
VNPYFRFEASGAVDLLSIPVNRFNASHV